MRKKSSLKKKKGKKTYKTKKSKLNKPIFKNKSVQQKGGNLDIILPATALTLTAAAVGGVYISKNISKKKYNKQNIVNNKSNTSKTINARNASKTTNARNTSNTSNASKTSQENRQGNFMETCSDMNYKKCEESKNINNKIIINLMLGKIEETNNFSIESVLLEPEQTIDKTYRSLLELATDKYRTVSSYVNKYIKQLFHAYFLFELSENNKITFSEAFTEDLKNYFSEQLQTIRKTALDKDKQNIDIPETSDIKLLFDAAKSEFEMIMSVINEPENKINKNDEENIEKKIIKTIEKKFIEKSAPEHIKEIGYGELPDLESPQNFYTKLINRHYDHNLLN